MTLPPVVQGCGVDLRVGHGQEAPRRECGAAFWAAVIPALQPGYNSLSCF